MIVSSAVRLLDGEVVLGYRHWQAFTSTFRKGKTYKRATQGFVDERGRFLDRKQGAREAWRCRQTPRRYDRLMSENVWPHDLPEWGTRPPLWALWPPEGKEETK